MTWTTPAHDISAINSAGKILRLADDSLYVFENLPAYTNAVVIANNWRAAHAFPLNTIQVNLRATAKRIIADLRVGPAAEPVVAQRQKRLASIERKLKLIPSMRLSQIQDIGGCRAILPNIKAVRAVEEFYKRFSRIEHQITKTDDYIDSPKKSGYRGIHLIFSYRSRSSPIFNGLKIEMQLRSRYQHAWATAVETVSMFTGQALKSNLGGDDWIRFFALMSSFIAYRERRPLVPDTPHDRVELQGELRKLAIELRVVERLQHFRVAMSLIKYQFANSTAGSSFLLELDASKAKLDVTEFSHRETRRAEDEYAKAEKRVKENPGLDAVLVSVDSVQTLSRAYPNYFADTRVFLSLLDQALSGRARFVREPAVIT